jgi:hypothetical protein
MLDDALIRSAGRSRAEALPHARQSIIDRSYLGKFTPTHHSRIPLVKLVSVLR